MTEPRKASDVLLELESKINLLLESVKVQNVNIMVLSNKLNDVMAKMEKKITVEAVQNFPVPVVPAMPVDPERAIPFSAETQLPQEHFPQGFRRTSRPETYVNEDTFPAYEEKNVPAQAPKMPQQQIMSPQGKMPMQPPPGRSMGVDPSIMGKPTNLTPPVSKPPAFTMTDPAPLPNLQNHIPVMQRCIDKNNKSIFLANVEITDLATNQQVFKNRSKANGKWEAPLPVGKYRVDIKKYEALTKATLQATQDFQVDGRQSRLELPNLIVK